MDEYLNCLEGKADEPGEELDEVMAQADDAVEAYNDTVETFNCIADGGGIC